MPAVETILHSVGLGAAVLSLALRFTIDSGRRRTYVWLAALSLLMLLAVVILRWMDTGHPPIFGTYENSLAASCAILGVVLWMDLRAGSSVPVWHSRLMAAWVPVTLGYGLFFSRQRLPLTISERSLWIDLHATFAWAAYAILLSASMAGIARLIIGDEIERDALEASIVRGIGTGFALFTGVIVVGSIYTHELFAEWFRWEIVEVFSAATWLAYGLALHARLISGWRAKRLAWLVIVILPLLLGSFWSWSIYQNTYHFFDIVPIPAF